MKTDAIREALAFMRRAGVDGSTGFVLAEAEYELDGLKNGDRADLRDTFAAAALTGMLADPSANNTNFEMVTKEAYRFADAMLKAREGK